jgi:hypothetical protein
VAELSLHGLGVHSPKVSSLGSAVRLGALIAAFVGTAGCSNIALPKEDMQATSADPGYGKVVGDQIKKSFKTLQQSNTFEISSPRWMHTFLGWNWTVCVRFQENNVLRTYAVLIKDNTVVTSRYAVETDTCDSQTYSPFNLDTGSSSSTGGLQGPLY